MSTLVWPSQTKALSWLIDCLGFISLFLLFQISFFFRVLGNLSPLFCFLLDQLHNLFHHFIFIFSPASEFWQFSGFCSLPSLDLWAFFFFSRPIAPAPSSWLLPLVDRSHSISLGAGHFFTGAIYLSCRLCRLYAFKASVKEMGDREL